MTLTTGTRLGRYEVRSLVGAGGMGEVYLAEDAELNRPVALKMLLAEVAADERRMQRFVQEARAASALNHPNILTVYDIGQTEDGTRFFATEFVEGETLRERMRRGGQKLGEVLDVCAQIASALVAAHAAGIVHRDVKPENVMIRRDGYVKVLDFGLAKLTGSPSSSVDTEAATRALVQTDPGSIMGTVGYMSPEQASGKEVDARTDIWSLGVVLYEMLTGRLPFEGKSVSHTIVSILDEEPPPLARFMADAPEALQELVSDALTKDADARFQTAKQMLSKLRRLKQRLDAGARLDQSVAPDLLSRASNDPANVTAGAAGASAAQQTVGAAQATTARSIDAAETVPSVSSAEFVAGRIKDHKKGLALALVLVVAAVAGLAFAAYKLAGRSQTTPADARSSMKIMPLTDAGNVYDAVVSPEGRYVAYVAHDGDRWGIHLRQVNEPSDKEIVPPLPDFFYAHPVFSPDGNYIVYRGYARGEWISDLYRVPVLGGAIRRLNHDADCAVTFSPDGRQFAFVRNNSKAKDSAIIVSGADGTGERQLAVRKSPENFLSLSWSPDGQSIAYTLAGVDKEGYYTHVGEARSTDGQETMISTARWRFVPGLAWLPDKSGLVIAGRDRASAPGTPAQIWQLSYPGGEARKVTNDLTEYASVSLTGDGKTLVATKHEFTSNVWVAPAGDSARARQISNGRENGNGGVAWTPDGRVVYTSRASGYLDLWIMNADGSAPRQLTFGTDANNFPVVSPDGRYIVFETNRSVGWSIWRMNADGGGLKELVQNVDQNCFAQFSPDSRWVFYATRDASGKRVMWRVPADGGAPEQLTHKDASPAAISPDGKLMYYYYRESPESPSKIEIVPTTGGEPVRTLDPPKDDNNSFWSPDGRSLVYVKDVNNVSNLWALPLDGGQPRQLTDWQTDQIFLFAYSRDGRQLAVARGNTSLDAVLIRDFR